MNNSQPNTHNNLVVDFEYEDTAKQQDLMRRLTNILNDFTDMPLNIEVVTYGPAIRMLTSKESAYAVDIKRLQNRGIVFYSCHNTMTRYEITEDQLLKGVIPVSSGLGYIVKKQLDSYVYLKG